MTADPLPVELRARVWELGSAGLGPVAIARTLAVRLSRVRRTYWQGQVAGVIPRRTGTPRNLWTPAEAAQLQDFIDEGLGYDDLAERLGRSRTAIIAKCQRMGYSVTATPAVLTAGAAAALLGITALTVVVWIRRGWLTAHKDRRFLWRIHLTDLYGFLEDPQRWMLYDPTRATDPALRAHLLRIRQGQPQWLTLATVAQHYSVSADTAHDWAARGLLPAVRHGWSYFVNERDLVGFVPPCMRQRSSL